jgi:hypothetical protein
VTTKKSSALSAFVKSIKSETKAERSPSATLAKIIEDYCASDRFDRFLDTMKSSLPEYISEHQTPRLFTASAAGKCQQQQVFKAVRMPKTDKQNRPPRQFRALYNGTFSHLRWHIMFDALHYDGTVVTFEKEHRRFNDGLNLSGAIDRLIQFDYMGKPFKSVIDFKTIKSSDFVALRKPQWDHYLSQHAYSLLGYDSNGGMVLYENKDTQEIKVFDFPYDEVTTQRLRSMYANMERWVLQHRSEVPMNARELLPLIVKWCRYCEWQKACLVAHPDLPEQQNRIGEEESDYAESGATW